MPWSVTVGLGDVAARLGYQGQLAGARVSRTGPSGRALEVTLDGSSGPKPVAGVSFAAALGLRSTLLSIRLGSAAAAPAPPPPSQGAQAPPDEAGAIAAATDVGLPAAGRATGGARLFLHPHRSGGWRLALWPGVGLAGAVGLAAVVARTTGRRPDLVARSLWQRLRRAEP
jgi:hypothetical protein